MTTAIRAIETRYAGCRFRSRLEARWGVFFDKLGVEWQYEPQGYEVGPVGTPYLPDFYLPASGHWVEVKGKMTAENLRTLIFAVSAAGLPYTPDTRLSRDLPPWLQRIVILGDVPEPGKAATHITFDVIGDLVVAQNVVAMSGKPKRVVFMPIGTFIPLNQYVAGAEPSDSFLDALTSSGTPSWIRSSFDVDAAYTAARAARFEHGEQG